MRLPPLDNRPSVWPLPVMGHWVLLTERAMEMEAKAGGSDAFLQMLKRWREVASAGRFAEVSALLRRRIGARALTFLWLNDEQIGLRLLNLRMLELLKEGQKPRLTRLTLIQLIQLYFRHFDRLNACDKLANGVLLERLQKYLHEQLELMPEPKQSLPAKDILSVLKHEGRWLLNLNGPLELVNRVHEQGRELSEAFVTYGLGGFDTGRYADICRAHFYLETLRGLRLGAWDPVLDELLKPSVNKAPYEDDKRIGHVALEIMIDRAGDDPSESWKNFILNLAGDPRISSSAVNYREWWMPLGEARISKVRSWLSKEDLRLFLQAVEQYGIEANDLELQRMFPARKLFLEGLFKLKLIRNTRLMLGARALNAVNKILGSEVKTNFARMDSSMSDKAVIYLDCGDFHLIEGSHNFKIWLYLAAPGEMLNSYDKTTFSHYDLTKNIPKHYNNLYPTLPYVAFTHHRGSWQKNVFQFLGDNGIGLDIEQLISRQDYKVYLRNFGMPVVNAKKVHVPTAIPQPAQIVSPHAIQSDRPVDTKLPTYPISNAPHVQKQLGVEPNYPSASRLTRQPKIALKRSSKHETEADLIRNSIEHLSPQALEVLRYFANNPGDKARYTANTLGIQTREVNQLLFGPLKKLCKQDAAFGWTVLPAVDAVLDKLFLDPENT